MLGCKTLVVAPFFITTISGWIAIMACIDGLYPLFVFSSCPLEMMSNVLQEKTAVFLLFRCLGAGLCLHPLHTSQPIQTLQRVLYLFILTAVFLQSCDLYSVRGLHEFRLPCYVGLFLLLLFTLIFQLSYFLLIILPLMKSF